MSAKSGSRELIWIVTGALALLAILFTVVYFRADRDPTAQYAFQAKRVELVNAMRLALAEVSEAQNSAVMSTAEQDSRSFAAQAGAAAAALERARTELQQLQNDRGDQHQLQLMDRVAQSFREFQRIDKQLLDLAVRDSNRKAYNLAFGPATKLLQNMDAALDRIVADHANTTSDDNMRVLRLASDTRIGVLRIQLLLLPHIAEESDQKMDELETQLMEEDRKVRESLKSLEALLPPTDSANAAIATALYEEFDELRSQIIKLSRENTDLRAVAIALNEKRKGMLTCQDALAALERAIRAESIITTIPSGR